MFVPATVIRDVVVLLVDAEYQIPVGQKDVQNRYDGIVTIVVDGIEIETQVFHASPQYFSVSAITKPDREYPTWANVKVQLNVDALFVPIGYSIGKSGKLTANFRISPNDRTARGRAA